MTTAFGLDIAGYSTGKSGFARAIRSDDGQVSITVLQNHPFSIKLDGTTRLDRIATQEVEALKAALEIGALFVDGPIDLHGLPPPERPVYVWELTKRPIDVVLGAMPALADRIGTVVARFRHLLDRLDESCLNRVGTSVFETYPAASLAQMGFSSKGYKGEPVHFREGQWVGSTKLAQLANALGFQAREGTLLGDDDLDAALCALTGVVVAEDRLEGEELERTMNQRIAEKLKRREAPQFPIPKGYVLLKRKPNLDIRIDIAPFSLHTLKPQEVSA